MIWALKWIGVPLLSIGLIAAGIYALRASAYASGREAALAALRVATEREDERRAAVVEKIRAEAEEASNRALAREKDNAALVAQIVRLSASRNHSPCLDADGVRRINQIGQ